MVNTEYLAIIVIGRSLHIHPPRQSFCQCKKKMSIINSEQALVLITWILTLVDAETQQKIL